VDEALDSLHARGDWGAIVVAVDNGGERRLDEYSPWRNARYNAGGEGAAYVDFLATVLKPYVDEHYRTKPEREHTGVAGSSMGGLISLYAVIRHPYVFGRAGVFSPAFWFTGDDIFSHARGSRAPRRTTRFYLVTGAREGDTPEVYVRDAERMAGMLADAGFAVEALIREDGTHSEGFWRREFPAAYRWLFAPD
jgi:metallo-beta-lactamase class B